MEKATAERSQLFVTFDNGNENGNNSTVGGLVTDQWSVTIRKDKQRFWVEQVCFEHIFSGSLCPRLLYNTNIITIQYKYNTNVIQI